MPHSTKAFRNVENIDMLFTVKFQEPTPCVTKVRGSAVDLSTKMDFMRRSYKVQRTDWLTNEISKQSMGIEKDIIEIL